MSWWNGAMRHVTSVLFILAITWLFVAGNKFKSNTTQKEEQGRYILPGKVFPLYPFPFLDQLDVPSIFSHRHYLTFIFKCVFFEGYCDLMGKWLKRETPFT